MSWKSWNGAKVKAQFSNEAGKAVLEAVEALGAIADQQVPHDDGTLQRSKSIRQDPNKPTTVYIAYGGGGQSGHPIVPYAIKWHEIPANFQKGRKHNYLRDPINQDYRGLLRKALNQRGLK